MTAVRVQTWRDIGSYPIRDAFDEAIVWQAVAIAILALQLVLTLSHHAWVDEWQALQIAAQAPTLRSLFESLRYEGHPPLWYFVLRAMANVLPGQWVLPATAALCAVVGQSIILFRSPFARIDRLLLALGVVMMFEFMTIARGTTLGVMLVVVAIALMRTRWVWLPIVLLPMVDFMFGVISIILILFSARDHRLWWPGMILWLCASLFAGWSVIPAPDFVPANQLTGFAFDSVGWLKRLGVMLVPIQMSGGALQWESQLPFGLGIVAGPLFMWFAYRQTRHDRCHLAIIAAFTMLSFVFSVAIYPQHVRHLAVIPLVLYLLKWRDADAGRSSGVLFRLWLGVGAGCGLIIAGASLTRPFDQAHLAARFITDNKLQGESWLVYPENRAQGISALTGIGFERVGQNCTQTFIRWNARTEFADIPALDAYLRAAVKQNGRFYFLTDFRVVVTTPGLVRQLAAFTGSYRGQDYYINVVGRDVPRRPRSIPACVPGLRRFVSTH